MKVEPITLATLVNGEVQGKFALALAEVLANIDDPGTDAKKKRRITIEVEMEPDKERRRVETTVTCTTKLAGQRAVGATLFIGRAEGKLVACEFDPRQMDIRDVGGEVVPLKKGETK